MKINPEKLNEFLDNPRISSRERLSTTIFHSWGSWDGLSVDPRPFSKFDENNTVRVGRRPAGCAGKRVIELNSVPVGGIFETPALKFGHIPMSIDQEIVSRSSNIINIEETISDFPFFKVCGIELPVIENKIPPLSSSEYRSHFLPPKMRKSIHDFDIKSQISRKTIRRAKSQENRLYFLMKKDYPSGVLQVDSALNPETQVYKDDAVMLKNEQERLDQLYKRRKNFLQRINGPPEYRHGYDPFTYNIKNESVGKSETKNQTELFSSSLPKISPFGTTSHHIYTNTAFNNNCSPKKSRNAMKQRREYNIVNGTVAPFYDS